jgi:transcriptional regulator with XRE-family HTH domain
MPKKTDTRGTGSPTLPAQPVKPPDQFRDLAEDSRKRDLLRDPFFKRPEIIAAGVSARIEFAVRHASMSLVEIARRTGISRATLYDWMNGKSNPGIASLALLAQITDASLGWIVSGQGPNRAGEVMPGGYLLPTYEYSLDPSPLAFHGQWLKKFLGGLDAGMGQSLCLIEIPDDAMAPSFQPRDLALVHMIGIKRGESGVFAVFAKPAIRIRRVQWDLNGNVLISCDNPAYLAAAESFAPDDAPPIRGRVIWRSTRVP